MQLLLKLTITSLIFMGSAAWADPDDMCACFCVEGSLKTMCSDVEDAQDNPNECSEHDDTMCPIPTGAASNWSYETPEEDATNCRDVRVWENDSFSIVKACDVLSES